MVLFQLRKPASEWEGGMEGCGMKRGVGPGKNGGVAEARLRDLTCRCRSCVSGRCCG